MKRFSLFLLRTGAGAAWLLLLGAFGGCHSPRNLPPAYSSLAHCIYPPKPASHPMPLLPDHPARPHFVVGRMTYRYDSRNKAPLKQGLREIFLLAEPKRQLNYSQFLELARAKARSVGADAIVRVESSGDTSSWVGWVDTTPSPTTTEEPAPKNETKRERKAREWRNTLATSTPVPEGHFETFTMFVLFYDVDFIRYGKPAKPPAGTAPATAAVLVSPQLLLPVAKPAPTPKPAP